MATKTMGTNGTTTLPFALQWQPGGLSPADLATLTAHIKADNAFGNIEPRAVEMGQLFLPKKRGVIRLLPGDWIAVGTTGWPILIADPAVTADWTHS